MRISDWSSDVCSSDLLAGTRARVADFTAQHFRLNARIGEPYWDAARAAPVSAELAAKIDLFAARGMFAHYNHEAHVEDGRSEEHTSELQSLMRNSYADFCLNKKTDVDD